MTKAEEAANRFHESIENMVIVKVNRPNNSDEFTGYEEQLNTIRYKKYVKSLACYEYVHSIGEMRYSG